MALDAAAMHGAARSGLGAAAVGGKIFVLGGHTGEAPLRLREEFEPGPDIDSPGRWRTLAPMLARRTYCTACAIDDTVYVIGGSADGRALNSFEMFHAETGEQTMWFEKPPMHIKRTMHASVVCRGRIIVAGGFDGMRDLQRVEEFDMKTNAWRWGSYLEQCRSFFAMAAVGEEAFVIGGQDRRATEGPRALASMERLDPACERWFPAAPLLAGRVGCAAATLRCEDGLEYVFVCGGSDGAAAMVSMERYDPREDAWAEAPPMSVPRLGHAAVVVDNRLYAIAGSDGKEPLGTFECFDPLLGMWGPALPAFALPPPSVDDI